MRCDGLWIHFTSNRNRHHQNDFTSESSPQVRCRLQLFILRGMAEILTAHSAMPSVVRTRLFFYICGGSSQRVKSRDDDFFVVVYCYDHHENGKIKSPQIPGGFVVSSVEMPCVRPNVKWEREKERVWSNGQNNLIALKFHVDVLSVCACACNIRNIVRDSSAFIFAIGLYY